MGSARFTVVLFAAAAAACGKGPFSGSESAAAGFVLTSTGAPAAGVEVSGPAGTAFTDATGRFDVAIPGDGSSVLTFTSFGLAPVYRPVDPRGAEVFSVFLVLPPPPVYTTIDVTAGPATVTAGSAVLQFPQGSIATASGATPAGPVDAMITVIPPEQATQYLPFPLMDSEGSEPLPLISYGMVDVQLSYLGEPANLAPGAQAALLVPAPAGADAEVGLYYGDPDEGLWVLEGTAQNDGTMFGAVLPHLSWWNVDQAMTVPPAEKACVRLRFLAPDGSAVRGVEVHPFWQSGLTLIGHSESDGTFCYDCFPANSPVSFAWGVMLGRTAPRYVTGTEFVQTTGPGGSCGGDCQEVTVTIACAVDDECALGDRCLSGVCVPSGGGPGDTPWIGSWRMLTVDGMTAESLGVEWLLTMSATAWSATVSSSTASCTAGGTITDADADSMVQTVTQTDCPGQMPGQSTLLGWSVSGDTLTITGPSTSVWQRVSP